MENNFKPGDLALVIRANHPENIGRVVELVRFDDSELIDHAPYADTYTENPERLACWLVRGDLEVDRISGESVGRISTVLAAFAQYCLMPLRGDHAPDQQLVTGKPELVSA